jgi:hypothetical protein
MLTLYYAPGACSMASHIALEETGAPYEAKPVNLMQGEHLKPEYMNAVNPRAKVPALKTDDGILTENVAILNYLARTFPDKHLLPTDPIGTARALSQMAYLSNTVHPAFTHIMRPGRFASDESAHDNIKATARRISGSCSRRSTGCSPARITCSARRYSGGGRLYAGLLRLGQADRIAGPRAEELHRAQGPAVAAPGRQEGARTREQPDLAELGHSPRARPCAGRPRLLPKDSKDVDGRPSPANGR